MDTCRVHAADSNMQLQAVFPCNHILHAVYDNIKGQVLASVYYHYILSSFTIHMYITDVMG